MEILGVVLILAVFYLVPVVAISGTMVLFYGAITGFYPDGSYCEYPISTLVIVLIFDFFLFRPLVKALIERKQERNKEAIRRLQQEQEKNESHTGDDKQ